MKAALAVPKTSQLQQLKLLPPEKSRWEFKPVPASVALKPDPWWLVSGDWHYCLQFRGDEAARLVRLLTALNLDFSIGEQGDGAPNCADELHQIIEKLIDGQASEGDRGVAA